MSPTLVSFFHACQKAPGQQRKSGIVCEYQNFRGFLLAGGNGPTITCWDLEAENEVAEIPTRVGAEACVTTLTTAWDYDSLGVGPSPHKGLGRDIFVAGMSNGTIQLLDLRSHRTVPSQSAASSTSNKTRRLRLQSFAEHKAWVVSTSFAAYYGGQCELVSGTTEGTIQAWDLRMVSSLWTIEAQRSVMTTTMAVHAQVPMIATERNVSNS